MKSGLCDHTWELGLSEASNRTRREARGRQMTRRTGQHKVSHVWTEDKKDKKARTTLDGVATLGGTRLLRARRARVACIIVDTEGLFVFVCSSNY